MQAGEFWQLVSWLQQLPAMQSVQGMPFIGHTGGGPQNPLLHWLEQHWAGWLQFAPFIRQLQTPPWQDLVQHSAPPPHMAPRGLQLPQMPLLQMSEQHSLKFRHEAPL